MSHQTGAQSIALLCQMMELIPRLRQAKAVQNIKRQVPEFHACKCHGKGMRARTNPSRDRMGKAGKLGSDMVNTPERGEGGRKKGGAAVVFHPERIISIVTRRKDNGSRESCDREWNARMKFPNAFLTRGERQ